MAIYFSGKNYAMASMQSHATLFTQWMFAGYTNDTIWAELKEKGYLEEQIIEIIEAYKKHRHQVRSKKGFVLIVVGALLGFISCILTILDIFPALRDIILVGLTTLAISIAVLGCYYIFE